MATTTSALLFAALILVQLAGYRRQEYFADRTIGLMFVTEFFAFSLLVSLYGVAASTNAIGARDAVAAVSTFLGFGIAIIALLFLVSTLLNSLRHAKRDRSPLWAPYFNWISHLGQFEPTYRGWSFWALAVVNAVTNVVGITAPLMFVFPVKDHLPGVGVPWLFNAPLGAIDRVLSIVFRPFQIDFPIEHSASNDALVSLEYLFVGVVVTLIYSVVLIERTR